LDEGIRRSDESDSDGGDDGDDDEGDGGSGDDNNGGNSVLNGLMVLVKVN